MFSILALATLAVAQGLESIEPATGAFTEIPILGFGTYLVNNGQNASDMVSAAIQMGYRHIDTAAIYQNQKSLAPGIQEGLKKAGVRREDFWVTSKLWNSKHEDCETGLNETLTELGLEYLDLYLMHFPIGPDSTFDHVSTWSCMQTLVRSSGPRTRYIGISNFSPKQLDELLASKPSIMPKVHQMELHPYLQQNEWVARQKKEGISVVGYAPLGNTSPSYQMAARFSMGGKAPGPLLQNEVIAAVAKEKGCTSAQVVLAWNMKRGVAVIPKSVHKERLRENMEAFGKCVLSDEDMKKIAGMEAKWVGRFNVPIRTPHLFEGLQAEPGKLLRRFFW